VHVQVRDGLAGCRAVVRVRSLQREVQG
jgi:hypothetical protein